MRFVALIPLVAALAVAGCSSNLNPLRPYRMEIQQGNHLSQENVAKLKRGMTKDQVRFVLGTPLITDIFHADRWDYVYRYSPENSNTVEERRLTVIFDDERLVRLEGDVVAAGGEASAQNEVEEPAPRSLFEEGRL
ncbi:MAG TPA: outer membrane protein assembly factor BamE [Burkholderiales bacterium]|nr:outer membrane protein assembly factor BamE [Burkholderiales bacterium]